MWFVTSTLGHKQVERLEDPEQEAERPENKSHSDVAWFARSGIKESREQEEVPRLIIISNISGLKK